MLALMTVSMTCRLVPVAPTIGTLCRPLQRVHGGFPRSRRQASVPPAPKRDPSADVIQIQYPPVASFARPTAVPRNPCPLPPFRGSSWSSKSWSTVRRAGRSIVMRSHSSSNTSTAWRRMNQWRKCGCGQRACSATGAKRATGNIQMRKCAGTTRPWKCY
ncbi:hypothetical protein BCR44DRAFT_1436189 [Catenaria anguillulae PL171]|uniref:Uncharacterized protein n=1 Tax=Catenaria anguillulae PL171 TaxID=765915 RepID=A0A1Y2HL25_9FUNG|nr:hypothetical protein BCR44DRAFT_1436189 [Catenaria anguillulae PL171]